MGDRDWIDGMVRETLREKAARLERERDELAAQLAALRDAARAYREVAEVPPGNLDTVQDVARDALDDDRPHLVVRFSRDEATKSGRLREVPLFAPALAALRRWRELAPGVGDALVWSGRGGACHVDGYEAGWSRVRRMAGIERRVRFHDLRHTCASHLVQGTWGRVWSLAEVRDVLGHSTIRQTERYAHLCPGGIHDAARATSGALPETKGADVVPMRRGE